MFHTQPYWELDSMSGDQVQLAAIAKYLANAGFLKISESLTKEAKIPKVGQPLSYKKYQKSWALN